jgi:hypothetical protein
MDQAVIPITTDNLISQSNQIAYVSSLATDKNIAIKNESLQKAIMDKITCNRYGPSKNGRLESYLSDIVYAAGYVNKPIAMHFENAYPISDHVVEQLFNGIESLLSNKSTFINEMNSGAKINFSIKVTDHMQNSPHSFEFTLLSSIDMKYALAMLSVYRTVVQPFFKKHADLISRCAHDYDRVFVLNSEMFVYQNGKTIADTRCTFNHGMHYTEDYYLINEDTHLPEVKDDVNYRHRLLRLPRNTAHMNHFRRNNSFTYKHFPIQTLYLDLNYFNCYFVPLLDKFSKEDVC